MATIIQIPGLTQIIKTAKAQEEAAGDLNSRAIAAAETVARSKSERIKNDVRLFGANSWQDIIDRNPIEIPDFFKVQPYSFAKLQEFLSLYIDTAGARFRAENARTAPAVVMDHKPQHVEVQTEGFKLRPQQRKAVDAGVDVLWTNKTSNAILVPLQTGMGKSIIAGAFIKYLQDNNYFGRTGFFPFGRVFFLTPAPVVIKIKRTLKRMGVKNIDKEVYVLSHDAFRTKQWNMLFEDKQVKRFGNVTNIKSLRLPDAPDLIIVDENHRYKKEKSLKSLYLNAFVDTHVTKFVMTSATPGVTINDMMMFSIATGIHYMDAPLDRESWVTFAQKFTKGADPNKANGAATQRWRDYMGGCIVDPPNDPSKVKAINRTLLFNWKTDEERSRYRKLEEAYIAARRRCGEEPSEQGLLMQQFQIYRSGAELMSVPYWVEHMLKAHAEGFAPVAAVCYLETFKGIVLGLIQAGIPREKISIIVGGSREIKESEIFTAEQFTEFLNRKNQVDLGYAPADSISKEEWTRFRKTTVYIKDQVRRDETADEKRERSAILSTLKLNKQTDEERQDNIDAFQEGRTEFCIYTFAAGGTGVDLDQQVEGVRPRKVFATVCYYAEEFIQALGRCKRVATLSDVEQNMLIPRGTIVAEHVVPTLQKKIASIKKLATGGDDLVSVLNKAILKDTPAEPVDENATFESEDNIDEVEQLDGDDDDDK